MEHHADLYELLEIAPDADAKAVRAAYFAAARRHHPDRCASDPQAAEERMKAINWAFEVLRDPQRRAAYDCARRSGPSFVRLTSRSPLSAVRRRRLAARNIKRRRWRRFLQAAAIGIATAGAALLVSGLAGTRAATVRPRSDAQLSVRSDSANPLTIQDLRKMDQRVLSVAFRLSARNTEFCARLRPSLGWTLEDRFQYSRRLRSHLELGAYPRVDAVAAGGPAEGEGLRAGDEVLSINGVGLDEPRSNAPPSYEFLQRDQGLIDRARPGDQIAVVTERSGARRVVRLYPAWVCDFSAQVIPSRALSAYTDERAAVITSSLVAFSDDDELAAILGHEMAHALLRKRRERAPDPVSLALRSLSLDPRARADERNADYIGLYLAARAGYDPSRAVALWIRLSERGGALRFASISHPGDKERAELAARTAAEIDKKRAAGAPLEPNWPG